MESNLGPVAREITDNGDLAIGHVMDGPIIIAQHSAAQGHDFDRAFHPCNSNDITEIVLILQQNKEAVDDVFDEGLRAKADRKSGNAGAGQKRTHVDPHDWQDLHGSDKNDNEGADAGDDAGQSAQLLGAYAAEFRGGTEFRQAEADNAQQLD